MILGLDPALVVGFLGAGIVLNLTPGADVMYATASGAAGGPRAGIAAAFGVALGAVFHTVLAAAGLSALLLAVPTAFVAIKWAGAAYLVFLAYRAWWAVPAAPGQGDMRLGQAIARGFATNALNPKVALFILALLPQFTSPATGPVAGQMLVLGAIFAATGFLITAGYGIAAGLASRRFAAKSRLMNRVSAVVFIALALRLVLGETPSKA